MKRLTMIGFFVAMMAVLAGCTHTVREVPPVAVVNHYVVETDLTQAAQSASQSLAQLASIEKARYGHEGQLPFEKINSPALHKMVVVKWYGPVEQLLRNVSHKIGYTLQVYGKPPKTPILIDIDNTKNPTTAKQVITNADLQAKNNASVLIYAKQKVISLRYMGK